MAFASPRRADVAALRRSDRSKPLLLGLVCLAALGAATFSWAEQKGVGAPDDPTKVLIVSEGVSDIDHLGLLERAGFSHPVEASLAEYEERARKLEFEADGVEAVLAVADELGYGFVAFEDPQSLDFSMLELQDDAPEIDAHARYAVLSAGDLAFPHHLSVNPPSSEVVMLPGLGLLQALYAQARIHPDRELLAHHPTVDELHLQAQLDAGLFTVRRVASLESTASNLAVDIERLINEGGGRPLGLALESGGPIALPDGGVLSVVQDVKIVSRDGFVLDYALGEELRLEYTPAGGLFEGPDRRVRCGSLAGGRLPVEEFPELVTSVDGRILLVHTATEGLQAWAALDGGACQFERHGIVPSPSPGEKGLGVPSSGGRVARNVTDPAGASRLRIYDPRPDAGPAPPVDLASLENTSLGKPVWLTERYVAAGGRTWGEPGQEPHDAIFVFAVDRPDLVLRVDASAFGEGERLRQMAAIPGERAQLLVTTRGVPTKLFRLGFVESLDPSFDEPSPAPPAEEDPSTAPSPSPLRILGDEALSIELLHEAGTVVDPVVSPDGTWLAFSHREEDGIGQSAIAVLRIDPPATELIRVTDGSVGDDKPRFTADGHGLVFGTRVSLNIGGHVLVAPRVAAVPE